VFPTLGGPTNLPNISKSYQEERIRRLRSSYPATTERRIAIRSFVRQAAANLINKGPILDIGSGYRSSEPEFCAERLMPYYTIDKDASHGPDFIIDAHNLNVFDEETFEAVLLIEVLEHVEFPLLVMQEASRVLRAKGVMLLTVPFWVPLHPKDSYGDFWRFSPAGIRLLIRECKLEVLEFNIVGPVNQPFGIHAAAVKNGNTTHNHRPRGIAEKAGFQ